MKIEYPSFRYHATESPRIVNDPAEEAELGEGWADTPAAFEHAEPAAPAPETKKSRKGK